MKIGNNLKLLSDEHPFYVTSEVYSQLGIPEDQSTKRRAESLMPPTPDTNDLIDEFSVDITGIYEKVSREIMEKVPDSSKKIG